MTTKPAPIKYAFGKIPAYLRERPQWVCWQYAATDTGKWTKVPYSAKAIGTKAASTRPEEWAAFDDAVAAYQNPAAGYDGIGYCLAADEHLVGIDIDHAVRLGADGKPAAVDETARDIVAAMGSYAELSVSGTGVHVFAFGMKPGDDCKTGSVEMYSRSRFLTMTGRKLASAPATIETRPDELASVYAEYIEKPQTPATDPAAKPSEGHGLDDDTVLALAMGAKNGPKFRDLFEGRWDAHHGSQSEADLSLCMMLAFWTQKQAEQMDRLFRRSQLMRPKWDTRRGRSSYGRDTLGKAIAQTTEMYSPAGPEPVLVREIDAVTQLEDVTLDLTAERLIEPVPFPDTVRVGLPHAFAALYEGRSDAPYPYLYMGYVTAAAAAMSPYITVGSRYNPGRVGFYTVKIGPSAVSRKSFTSGETLAHFDGLPSPWGRHLYVPDSDPGSDVGLIRLVRPAMQDDEGTMVRPTLLAVDEFTVITKKIGIQGSTFAEILNRLFDYTTAGATSKQFDRQVTAHLSILSSTTDQLWTAGLGVEALDIGFVNRLFLVPAYRVVEIDSPTDPDLYAMQALQTQTASALGWAADRALAPVRFIFDAAGQAIVTAWQERMKALRVDGVTASYLDVSNRLDVYLRRLAAVLTVLGWTERPAPRDDGYPLDPLAVSVACDLASWQFQARWNAQPVTGENPWAVHESVLREYLRKHLKPGQRVERRHVAQRFKRWGSKGVDMAIVGLERNGEVVTVPDDRGHGGKGYVALSVEGLYPAV